MAYNWFPQLSKSRFLAELQCLKRLYLECYHPELADPVEAGRQTAFDTGHVVGELARSRFQGGVLVAEQYFEHSQAVRTTQALLGDPSIPALYEPAFTFEGIRTRIDVLVRTADRAFDLIEVKSTASGKDEHIADVAIQMHVVEGCTVSIGHAYLMHLNTTYVYRGGESLRGHHRAILAWGCSGGACATSTTQTVLKAWTLLTLHCATTVCLVLKGILICATQLGASNISMDCRLSACKITTTLRKATFAYYATTSSILKLMLC